MNLTRPLTLVAALLVALSAQSADKKDDDKNKKPNHLIRESSPYLLQHAYNPVDWHPWGPDAFAKAKKEGKLVFLSIGYSSCHWCHVMEKESFSHKDVAELLNKHFIPIKVDREERPDVDKIYMTALNVQGQRGGWPLSMFLMADGRPVAGGTYWPREDKKIGGQKLIGFTSILKSIIDAQKNQKKKVEEVATAVAEATRKELAGNTKNILLELEAKHLKDTAESLQEQFDPIHGGFGSPFANFRGTKFPTSPRLLFLAEQVQRDKSKEIAKMLHVTLDRMALGGIYDHLGGGFHRYSTERTWTVPHFEKMLYDNGQLVEIYAAAYATTKEPLYERVIRETLTFIEREMTSREGGFYSALDADSEGEEGRFYVWTDDDLKKALPKAEDRKLVAEVYGADDKLNFEEKYHIFVLGKPLPEHAKNLKITEKQLNQLLTPLKRKLFQIRGKRERPFLDTKILTAWNGLMIAGYAKAGAVLDEKKYLTAAEKAADFVMKNLMTNEGRLLRTYGAAPGQKPKAKLNAYLDDYACLVHGLLNLHEATKDKKWLAAAKNLTDTMIILHWDKKNDGFFYVSNDHEKLFAKAKDQYDGARPSGNCMAARNLVRLGKLTGEKKYRERAEETIKALGIPLSTNPSNVTTLVSALGLYLDTKK